MCALGLSGILASLHLLLLLLSSPSAFAFFLAVRVCCAPLCAPLDNAPSRHFSVVGAAVTTTRARAARRYSLLLAAISPPPPPVEKVVAPSSCLWGVLCLQGIVGGPQGAGQNDHRTQNENKNKTRTEQCAAEGPSSPAWVEAHTRARAGQESGKCKRTGSQKNTHQAKKQQTLNRQTWEEKPAAAAAGPKKPPNQSKSERRHARDRAADAPRELQVLGHDRHAPGVDRAEVAVLEEVHQKVLGRLWRLRVLIVIVIVL